MDNFIDKVKRGASAATKMAQITLEVNRLKLQISAKEKEIAQIFQRMGETAYQALQNDALENVKKELQEYAELIQHKKMEVSEMENEIRKLRTEKLCPACRKTVPADMQICYRCGYNFEGPAKQPVQIVEAEVVDIDPLCPNCRAKMKQGDVYCNECGFRIAE